MAVSNLKACYRLPMRFFSDRPDITTMVRWYFVPDDTPWVPVYNLFSSQVWNSEKNITWGVPGEDPDAKRQFVDGSAPAAFPADHVCGSADAWVNGVLYPGDSAPKIPPTWVPACCAGEMDPCTVGSWRIDASGFGPGLGCAAFNGSFTLPPFTGLPCAWQLQIDAFSKWVARVFDFGSGPAFDVRAVFTFGGPPQTLGQFRIPAASLDLTIGNPNVLPEISGSVVCPPPPTITATRLS